MNQTPACSPIALPCRCSRRCPPTHPRARTQLSVIQDDAQVIASGDATRNATLDEMRGLGADVVKITISWRDLANGGKPAEPRGPERLPRGQVGAATTPPIQGAVARGLGVFLNVGGPAPDWAVEGRRRRHAAERGRVRQVREGRRHALQRQLRAGGARAPAPTPAAAPRSRASCRRSAAPAPATRSRRSSAARRLQRRPRRRAANNLPAVKLWSVWNEPNLPVFLLPQRSSTKSHYPVSPTLYRGLYRAAYGGLAATRPRQATRSCWASCCRSASRRKTPRSSIRPLEFLRELACVDRHYHAYKGANAKARGCTGFKAIPMSGIAYHPYALAGGPTKRPPNRATTRRSARCRASRRSSTACAARGRFAGPTRLPLWLTEFGVQTDPPDYLFGAPIKRVPTYLGMSERIAMRNSRVSTRTRSTRWSTTARRAASSRACASRTATPSPASTASTSCRSSSAARAARPWSSSAACARPTAVAR